MMHRYSGYYLGKHKGIEIVGFKAQFTTTYGNNDECYFAETELGMGINIGTKYEGVQKNNLISTSILGPILILNPLFTKELLKTMGVKEPKLAFEEEVMAAYNERLKKFKKMTEKEKKKNSFCSGCFNGIYSELYRLCRNRTGKENVSACAWH